MPKARATFRASTALIAQRCSPRSRLRTRGAGCLKAGEKKRGHGSLLAISPLSLPLPSSGEGEKPSELPETWTLPEGTKTRVWRDTVEITIVFACDRISCPALLMRQAFRVAIDEEGRRPRQLIHEAFRFRLRMLGAGSSFGPLRFAFACSSSPRRR